MTQKTKTITIISGSNTDLRKIIPLLIIFFVAGCFSMQAQVSSNDYKMDELRGLFEAHKHKPVTYTSDTNKPKNEFEFLMASSFNVYKAFFSSQDNPSCVFHPSCSEYSVQALQQKNLLLGTLYTFDRLSRCHRLIKPGQYYFDPMKQRFYDPVR